MDKNFWDNRYRTNEIGWDIGYCSTPIKDYIDQLEEKRIRILIPGCGNGYEAEYLHKSGFTNVFVIDLSPTAIAMLQERVPDFPKDHLINGNYFDLKDTFDLIIEQTFFCAIDPGLRPKYAKKTHSLLSENGKLVGLLFDAPLNDNHPPFGGNKDEYLTYFSPYFNVKVMECAYNSIEPRADRELFIILEKK